MSQTFVKILLPSTDVRHNREALADWYDVADIVLLLCESLFFSRILECCDLS